MADWGPEETRVIATLADRPAGVLDRIQFEGEDQFIRADYTFAALYNGARSDTMMRNGEPWFGKAEAEWGWPLAWNALRDAGLVDWRIERRQMPAGEFDYFVWWVTELGHRVREDDLAYFRERMDARDKDEAPNRSATAPTPLGTTET